MRIIMFTNTSVHKRVGLYSESLKYGMAPGALGRGRMVHGIAFLYFMNIITMGCNMINKCDMGLQN